MELRRGFSKGVMNKDVDERLLPDGYLVDAQNVDIMNPEGSDAGSVRNIKGNTEVVDLGNLAGESATGAKTIGVVSSPKDNKIYWFVTHANFDGIYEYDEDTGNSIRVLQSSTGQLNFNADYRITGVNFIDGFLYWTDNLNPPRRVNVSLVKQWGIDDSRIDDYINVIVAPPLRPPYIEMLSLDSAEDNQENNMEDRFIQFAYRYKYRDNQYSSLSPFSATAFVPGQFEVDYAAGNNEAMLNTKNKVKVIFETGNQFVEEIQVVAFDTKRLNVYIVETFKKVESGIQDQVIPNHDTYSFIFKNNKLYTPLSEKQVTRFFDNVPIAAQAQEVIDSRIVYGNYTQFYDLTDCSGYKVTMNYTVGYESEDVVNDQGTQTFRTDRDYEIGIIYGDDYGRFSTVVTNPVYDDQDSNTVHIPITEADKAHSLLVEINHKAPCFATHYRLVVKESKKEYYNIFPILYYVEGVYRWFLINNSDSFKFNEGDYIIFKSDGGGPTYSNKEYKILEVAAKTSNFLDNGDSQVAGLYMKVKVDSGEFTTSEISNYGWVSRGLGGESVGLDQIPTDYILNIAHCIETPIHYGSGADDFSLTGTYTGDRNVRLTFEIESSGNTCRYTDDVSLGNWLAEGVDITGGSFSVSIDPYYTGGTSTLTADFSSGNIHVPGDRWVVMLRGVNGTLGFYSSQGENFVTYTGTSSGLGNATDVMHAIVPSGENYTTDLAINSGAIIKLEIQEEWFEGNPNITWNGTYQFQPSPSNYTNLEEWWYESGAYDQFEIVHSNGATDGSDIGFRRGDYYYETTGTSGDPSNYIDQGYSCNEKPLRMIIKGTEDKSSINKQSRITATLSITQLDNPLLAETKAKDALDVFYEIPHTYTINNSNEHEVLWEYEDYTEPNTVWGSEPWYDAAFTNKTNLGLADPSAGPTSANIPHYFQVGDTVTVTVGSGSAISAPIPVEVLYVPDQYNIIVDITFAAGSTIAGGVSLSETDSDQNYPSIPAKIKINNPDNPNSGYNAYAFGNGLESDRIRDDYNETTLKWSPRATNVVEDYGQEVKSSSLCYSGIYKEETSLNALNEFNLSKANFKNLDAEFGSIQKLYARDTDLVVFQENKVSRVLYGKNLLSDAVGGGQVSSIPEVLGTQVSIRGEYGISNNPESFAEWGDIMYWTDERRGSVLMSEGSQIIDISNTGMKDYFRDLFRDDPNTQHWGAFDPYRSQYIIASNDDDATPCTLNIKPTSGYYPGKPSGLNKVNLSPDFDVVSNTSWTMSIAYSAGTGWVTGFPASGFGNQSIYLGVADNLTGAIRTATITITYCGGKTETYDITQGAGNKVEVRPIVLSNFNSNSLF